MRYRTRTGNTGILPLVQVEIGAILGERAVDVGICLALVFGLGDFSLELTEQALFGVAVDEFLAAVCAREAL